MKSTVALLAEGVDRNKKIVKSIAAIKTSPSSRRAWIEMLYRVIMSAALYVALLAEGVDRNCLCGRCSRKLRRSPSSRRAWIEIKVGLRCCYRGLSPSSRRAWIEITQRPRSSAPELVALLAEGVDRNQGGTAPK